MLTVRGMHPNCENERGEERWFMLLDTSNDQNLVVCLGGTTSRGMIVYFNLTIVISVRVYTCVCVLGCVPDSKANWGSVFYRNL